MAIAADAWLAVVARQLGDLADDVVFVGGGIVHLLIDDPGASGVRPTDDLDLVVEVSSRLAYDALADRLHRRGFQPDTTEGAPICRL